MLAHHSGISYQHGQGLGSFLSGLAKTLVPVAKNFFKSSTGQALKNIAVDTAANVAKDIFSGGNVKESAKTNLSEARDRITGVIKKKILDPEEVPKKKVKPNKKGRKKKKIKKPFNLLYG